MKTTTYIMMGCIVAGCLAVATVTASVINRNIVRYDSDEYIIGGEIVSLPVEGDVHKVTFDYKGKNDGGYRIKLDNVRGITIVESDAARTASISLGSDWADIIKCSVDSGALTLSIDYDKIADIYHCGKAPELNFFKSESISIATVTVPRGQLREVAAREKTIYLDSIESGEIISRVDDRLVLNNSHIDLLTSRAKRLSELKLDKSTVGKATLKAVDKNFKVTCTDSSSYIGDLNIDGLYRDAKKGYFNFEKANIGDFKFNGDKSYVTLTVNMKPGVNYNMK